MHVYGYIDSQSVREYLRYLNYEFSSADAAFFVNRSAISAEIENLMFTIRGMRMFTVWNMPTKIFFPSTKCLRASVNMWQAIGI